MDTSICHNAHLGESMGQHRALYQIGGIRPGQKNDFTTARPLAKARDFRSGSIASLSERPVVAAGSTGRRNTGVKSLGWGFECQGLTRPFIELTRHIDQTSRNRRAPRAGERACALRARPTFLRPISGAV